MDTLFHAFCSDVNIKYLLFRNRVAICLRVHENIDKNVSCTSYSTLFITYDACAMTSVCSLSFDVQDLFYITVCIKIQMTTFCLSSMMSWRKLAYKRFYFGLEFWWESYWNQHRIYLNTRIFNCRTTKLKKQCIILRLLKY